ncbi:hypothetical protein EV426DRAFT_709472 [Tirmania nivea]|nr:hypothetical protein EV426DRAFT_709472 [Tirmania nivea]
MPDPVNSAWAYPLLGFLHLFTHPSTLTTPLQPLPATYFRSTTLFRTLLRTFILTTTLTVVLIITLFQVTDHIVFLVARNYGPLSILAQNGLLRNVVVLLGVGVQGALIAGKVVEYGVGRGARKVGRGVLAEKMRSMNLKDTFPTVAGAAASTGEEGVKAVGESVGQVFEHPLAAAKSVEMSLEHTLKENGITWMLKKLVSIPVVVIPIVGPLLYAAVNAEDLGWGYVRGYAKNVGVEKKAQEYLTSVKAFGLIAGALHALPVVGPVFYFSNFVGSALWVADLKGYKGEQKKWS